MTALPRVLNKVKTNCYRSMAFLRFVIVSGGLIALLAGCGGGGGNTSVSLETPTLSWSSPAAILYGTALGATQLNASSNYPGTFNYSPAAGTVMSAGPHTLTATFTPGNPSAVASGTVNTTLTVNQATPALTWNTPAAVIAGTALSSTQLDAASNVAGTFAYAPASGTVLNVAGTQLLSVVFTPADSTDYLSPSDSVLLPVQPSAVMPQYSWTNARIVGGGYVTGLYFHPNSQNLMYARTDVGGAYRRGPNDAQWVPLMDFISPANSNYGGVEALGLDPTNPNRLYLAVGEYAESWGSNGAMLVSTDQGATFKTVPLPFKAGSNDLGRGTGERIAVDPNLPSTVYFGTRAAGLQISTDYGSTWAKENGLPVTTTASADGVVAVLPIPASGSSQSPSSVVYAVTGGTGVGSDPVGIFVTTNGGSITSTWTPVSGQPSFTSASVSLAPLQARTGPDGSLYILYGDQPGPNTMTASQFWKFVPGSTWSTGTWTQISLPNQNLTINNSNGYGGIAVDPNHAGHLLLSTLAQYFPTADVIYRSTDDGVTWRDISSVKVNIYSQSPDLATHDVSLAPYQAFHNPVSQVSTGNWATSLAIDPFNPDHAVYGNGGEVWGTTDLTKADPSATSLGVVDWKIDAVGIEEGAIAGLWAPPSGDTLLLSSLFDNYGFAHQSLTVSPPQEMFNNPAATPTSMDYEQNIPTTVVRVTDGTGGASPIGVISTDAGLTWNAFLLHAGGEQGRRPDRACPGRDVHGLGN